MNITEVGQLPGNLGADFRILRPPAFPESTTFPLFVVITGLRVWVFPPVSLPEATSFSAEKLAV